MGRVSARSKLEEDLLFQIKHAKLELPETELCFAPPRKWRFDLAWPDRLLAVEIDGGLWIQGRHSRGCGQLADMEKFNAAALLGWKVLRVGSQHIRSGEALNWVERALAETVGSRAV